MKRTNLIALAVAGALGLSACGAANANHDSAGSTDSAKKTVTLLAVLPMSGPVGFIGQDGAVSMKVAADKINAAGGVNGAKLVIQTADDQLDPTKAVAAVNKAMNSDNPPDFIYPGLSDAEIQATLPLLKGKNIFTLGTGTASALDDGNAYPTKFQWNPTTDFVSGEFAKVAQHQGYKNVGLLHTNDGDGVNLADAYAKALSSIGDTTSDAAFGLTDLDLTSPVQKILNTKPDAIMMSSISTQAIVLALRARAKLGATNIPFFLDESANGDLASLVPAADLKNVYLLSFHTIMRAKSASNPAYVAQFLKDYAAAGGKFNTNLVSITDGSDLVNILALAANTAKSFQGDKMAAALRGLTSTPPNTFFLFSKLQYAAGHSFNTGYRTSDFGVTAIGPLVDGQYVTDSGPIDMGLGK